MTQERQNPPEAAGSRRLAVAGAVVLLLAGAALLYCFTIRPRLTGPHPSEAPGATSPRPATRPASPTVPASPAPPSVPPPVKLTEAQQRDVAEFGALLARFASQVEQVDANVGALEQTTRERVEATAQVVLLLAALRPAAKRLPLAPRESRLLDQVIDVRRQVRQAELDLMRRALAKDVPTAEEVANLSRLRRRLEKPLRENPEVDRLQERLPAVGLETERLYGLFPQP